MGLFDHLFKNRPESAEERTLEDRLKGSRGDADTPDPQTAFLQPKGYAPGATNPAIGGQQQGFVPVLPTARRPARSIAPPAKPAPLSAAAPDEILLVFGDVLPRIPVQFLRPGPHDLKRALRFHLEDLTSDLTRGRTGVALSRVAEQCPDFFLHAITDDDDMEVRLPLQKLVEQVARIRARPSTTPRLTPAPAPVKNQPLREAPAPKLAPPRLTVAAPPPEIARPAIVPPAPVIVAAPVAPMAPIEVQKEPLAEAPKVAPLQAVPTAPVFKLPLAPIEPPREIELPTPVAEPPPPVIEKPPTLEAPLPAPAPPTPDPVVSSELPVAVEIPVFAAAEPVSAEVIETRVDPPLPRLPTVAPEPCIDLSLAAITAAVPIEMLVAGRPHIAESFRISLPFAPIERQLGTGQVEVSGDVFWDALPPALRHHFLLRRDLSIPLSLEEIFQNLPVAPDQPRFEPVVMAPPIQDIEAPFVLAPAAFAEDRTEPLNFDFPSQSEPFTSAEFTPVETVAEPAPIDPEPLVVAAETEAAVYTPPELDETPSAESPISENPEPPAAAAESAVAVSLPPFRIFTPQVHASEAADHLAPVDDQPIFLGQPDTAAEPDFALNEAHQEPPPTSTEFSVLPDAVEPEPALTPSEIASEVEAEPVPLEEPAPAGVEAAETPAVIPAAPRPLEAEEPHHASRFSVLPSREFAAQREDAASVVAFSVDQPPPLLVEQPAAAVAVLHATIPAPQPAAHSAGPSISVQPPRMFRPVVLPPPITGHTAAPVNLAPTLGGPPPATGVISLAPAPLPPAPRFDTPPPRSEAPSLPAQAPPLFSEAPSFPAAAPHAPELPPRIAQPPAPAVPVATEPARVMPPLPLIPPEPSPMPAAEPPTLHLPLPPPPSIAAPSTPAETALPALALSRFDQHSLQSLFMTDETLDLPKVARLAAALPGIEACVVSSRGDSVAGGQVPPGFELSALRGLAPQIGAAADRLPIGELKNFTLNGAAYSVSLFERGAVCLCVVHRARSFVPGVREKLVAVTEELAR